MNNIAVIRERGQLTIPDSVRKVASWAGPLSVVSVSIVKSDEIVIRPHRIQLNRKEIWRKIRHSRSVRGKGNVSASQFLLRDRELH